MHNSKNKTNSKSHNILERQMLNDLEQRININVGSFLVLSEEGDPQQIAFAHQQAKTEFLKFGPEMHKIAMRIGGPITQAVDEYLASIDMLLHCPATWIDEDKITHCYHTTQRLDAELR